MVLFSKELKKILLMSTALVAFSNAPVCAADPIVEGPDTLTFSTNSINTLDVSDNGNVFGYYIPTGQSYRHGYVWNTTDGLTDVGTLGGTQTWLYGMSSDGNVVAGYSYIAGDTETHAVYWSEATGLVDIGTLGGTSGSVKGVSSDGSVLIGTSKAGDGQNYGYRWTEGTGMVSLG